MRCNSAVDADSAGQAGRPTTVPSICFSGSLGYRPGHDIRPHRFRIRRRPWASGAPVMSAPRRKARPRRANNESNRRDELLRVSARLFREKGFDGTSIRDISDAAGMHSGSPFYHFKTKQDILVAVMEQGLAEGLRKAEEVVQLPLPAEERLVRVIRAQLGTILDEGNDFIPVLLYDWRSLSAASRRRIVAVKDRYDAVWQQLIDELHAAGHITADPQLARLLILGAVNWTGTWYKRGGRLSLDDIAADTARLILHHDKR